MIVWLPNLRNIKVNQFDEAAVELWTTTSDGDRISDRIEAFSWLLLRFYILFVGGILSQLISFRSHATLARRTKEQWQRRNGKGAKRQFHASQKREATIPLKPKARSDNSAETKSAKRQFRASQKPEATIPRKADCFTSNVQINPKSDWS